MNRKNPLRTFGWLLFAALFACCQHPSCRLLAQEVQPPRHLPDGTHATSIWKKVADSGDASYSAVAPALSNQTSSRRGGLKAANAAPGGPEAKPVDRESLKSIAEIPIRVADDVLKSTAGASLSIGDGEPKSMPAEQSIGDLAGNDESLPAMFDHQVQVIESQSIDQFGQLTGQFSSPHEGLATRGIESASIELSDMTLAEDSSLAAENRKLVSPSRFRIPRTTAAAPISMSFGDHQEPAGDAPAIQEPNQDLAKAAAQEAKEEQELMERLRQPLPGNPLSGVQVVINPQDKFHEPIRFTDKVFGRYPENAVEETGPRLLNYVQWQPNYYAWAAPDFYHQPLYYEDANLERYGINYGILQPAQSAAQFLRSTIYLPLQTGVYPPCERIYTLGSYRPGSCNPAWLSDYPVTPRGVMRQSLFTLTGIFIVP